MSYLGEQRTDLARFHHPKLLNAIHAAVMEQNPLSWYPGGKDLFINTNAIAQAVWKHKTWTASDILSYDTGARIIISSCFTGDPDLRKIHKPLKGIRDLVRARFLLMAARAGCSPEALLQRHLRSLEQSYLLGSADANREIAKKIFSTPDFVQRRTMNLHRHGTDEPIMRAQQAIVTLQVPNDIISRLADALQREAFARWKGDQDDIVEIIAEQRADQRSALHQLIKILNTETVSRLHRELRVWCLTYMADYTNVSTASFLRELARRLRTFQTFLRNADTTNVRPDSAFKVTFLGEECDLRVLFGQAGAWDKLPLFPTISAHISESNDPAKCVYTFGLAWKFNGKVTTEHSSSSYTYHLDFLRGKTKAQAEKAPYIPDLVHRAVLYYIAFAHFGDANFNPIATLHRDVLAPLATLSSSGDIQAGYRVLNIITQHYTVTDAVLHSAAEGIKQALHRKQMLSSAPMDVSVHVLASIMESDRNRFLYEGEPFKPVFTPERKEYMAYIDITDENVPSPSLLTLDAQLRINDAQLYPLDSDQGETYTSKYETRGIANASVSLYRSITFLQCQRDDDLKAPDTFGPNIRVPLFVDIEHPEMLHHLKKNEQTSVHWFLYRYVTLTILYICLDVLGEFAPDALHLYFSLLRKHEQPEKDGDPDDVEGFLAMLGKTTAFMLGHDYLANSQGIHDTNRYQASNALESLVSVLPKRFTLQSVPQHRSVVPRVALVVVSSRESDRALKTPREQKLITAYGEIIDMSYDSDRSIIVRPLRHFSGTDKWSEVFSSKSLIIDEIQNLYAAGYRHIIYLAQSPHTTTLKITKDTTEIEQSALFYLSPTVVSQFMKGTEDDPLHLYPLFRNEYSAMRLQGFQEGAWLIDDPHELAELVSDRSRSMAMFMNILSGRQVNRDAAFHGVATYATLLNIYDVLNERDLRGLLYDPELRAAISQYLLLYHLARYESSSQMSVKLDPYEGIIGSGSIGAVATRDHVSPYIQCNFMAYLSLVRQALRAEDEHGK